MSDAFTVLWTHDTCRALREAGRVGERPPVAFSGVHSSLPAWSGARTGDEGAGGCGAQAVHVDATPVRFDVPVSGVLLTRLTWRNRLGQTRGLKHIADGRPERSISLQGFYRLTPEAADELAEVVRSA
ncbi:hypothetical protein EAO77_29190 [Streptomyces sp. t39]|nr:hypothetical protein EAO77_29190 [Streptomyces sp. t39]